MNQFGAPDILVATRSALLDALEALADQRSALVLIGAQAIYLHTGDAPVALAEATKDSDLAVDPRILNDHPRLEEAMQRAGFLPDPIDPQPGSWVSPRGIPVDLMVPARLSGGVLTWALPRAAFHGTLRELLDAGLGDRIMFGTDQMIWPGALGLAIDAVKAVPGGYRRWGRRWRRGRYSFRAAARGLRWYICWSARSTRSQSEQGDEGS